MIVKDSGLWIRVQRELLDEFLNVRCFQGKSVGRVIREFMRDYIAGAPDSKGGP